MKKITLNVKAVIFDMDGVITNTMPDHYRAWNIVMNRQEKIHVTHFDVYSHEGQPGINFLQDIFTKNQLRYDEKRARHILKKKEDLFKTIVRQRFIPGARSFLKELHRKALHLALVTGTARHELHKILPDTLYRLFRVIVTGTEVKKGKPDPEPYQNAVAKLGFDPARIVVIENAPYGIQSAKAAGLRCLAVESSLPRTYLTRADHVFGSIKEMKERVDFFVS